MFRKVANRTKPTIEVAQEAGQITWKTISTFWTSSTTFVLNEAVDEKQANGKVMSVREQN